MGRRISQHYLKNDQELNKKKKQVFSTEPEEQHQNIKRTEIIMYKGILPLVNNSLSTLSFF